MKMEKEIEKYDPSRLMEMVRDRIRATYVSLIPETQWTQMVQKEINTFFTEYDTGYRTERISPFRKIVYSELEKKAKEIANRYLESISSNQWENDKCVPGEFVKQLFAEKSGEILLGVLGGMVQNAINNARTY